MTDPTPTRDEAVPTDERRIDLPNGYYLFQIRPSDMTCSLHMPDGQHIGNLLSQYAGDFADALARASAPAPASGGVDAAFTVASNLLRDGCTYVDRKAAADFIRSALSPAATPVSEAEPAVAEAIDDLIMAALNHERAAPGHERGSTLRILNSARSRVAALAKPASSPAGVREASLSRSDVCRLWQHVAIERPSMTVEGFTNLLLMEIDDRAEALSQSTSAGRVGE